MSQQTLTGEPAPEPTAEVEAEREPVEPEPEPEPADELADTDTDADTDGEPHIDKRPADTPGHVVQRVRESIEPGSTRWLEAALKSLEDADRLGHGLNWSSTVWDGCTTMDLLGALIEAEQLLNEQRGKP